jgi:uncharacterized protein
MDRTPDETLLSCMVRIITARFAVDAVYLYGSRAKGTALEESDWDIAVLFSDYLTSPLDRALRPQKVEEILQRELGLYDRLSVVDLEIVPLPLQWAVINGLKIYDRNVPHVRRVEHSIVSKLEKDYALES